MQLADFLNKNDMSISELARKIEVSTSHLARIIAGKRGPSQKMMHKITKATNGAVKPADFFPEVIGKERAVFHNSRPRTL